MRYWRKTISSCWIGRCMPNCTRLVVVIIARLNAFNLLLWSWILIEEWANVGLLFNVHGASIHDDSFDERAFNKGKCAQAFCCCIAEVMCLGGLLRSDKVISDGRDIAFTVQYLLLHNFNHGIDPKWMSRRDIFHFGNKSFIKSQRLDACTKRNRCNCGNGT